jgi:hypothetical protein
MDGNTLILQTKECITWNKNYSILCRKRRLFVIILIQLKIRFVGRLGYGLKMALRIKKNLFTKLENYVPTYVNMRS